MVWSHGWVDAAGGRFTDPFGFLRRTVLDHLQDMKLPSETIERVAFGNYARVLKAVLN